MSAAIPAKTKHRIEHGDSLFYPVFSLGRKERNLSYFGRKKFFFFIGNTGFLLKSHIKKGMIKYKGFFKHHKKI